MRKLLLAIAALGLLATTAAAQTTVLWDQSDFDAINQLGMWDAVSGCAPFGGSIHYAHDVLIHDQVTITSISTYYTAFNFDTESATEAYLYIGPKTGSLPIDGIDMPQEAGTLVPISVSMDPAGVYVVTASGLAESLNPGQYWVSLTPILPGGMWGPDFHIISLTSWGDPSAWYEYCGQFAPAWGPNIDSFDGSILIEGTVDVVPNAEASWGDLKSLYR